MSIKIIKAEMIKELENEKKVRNFIENRKAKLPPGSLQKQVVGEETYYYQQVRIEGEQKSIFLDKKRDEDCSVISELMEKKTVVHGLPVLRRNIDALEKCIPVLESYSPLNHPYGAALEEGYFLDDQVCIKEWLKQKAGNEKYFPASLIHETKSGILVRSKSEVLIADALYELRIRFKYENGLWLGSKKIYPDFEIVHPVDNRLIWWENFGMMDDPIYVESTMKKIDDYRENGIILGDNLIITWENRNNPLTHRTINKMLKQYKLI